MHRIIPALAAAWLLCGLAAAAAPTDLTLTNTDGTLRFSLQVQNGAASYSVDSLAGSVSTPVLENSPLGLTRTDADFTQGLTLGSASDVRTVEDNYTLVTGKQRQVHSRGVERTFTLKNATGMTLTVTARAYRDGVAFRYGLPGKSSEVFFISDEATGFKLPATARIWTQPYSKVAECAPAYEANYVNGIPAGTVGSPEGWSLPLLFNANNLWALVTESALEPTYFGIHLQPTAPDGLYRARLPEVPETYGVAPQQATITLPWFSPWRVVIVGHQAGAIADSTLVTDLARPSELKDTSWIKSGVASWSWWSDTSSPSDYAKLTASVDVAEKFHWPYCTIDLGWHTMHGGDIKQLIAYAAKKNVGLLVWYNSAGKHNTLRTCGPVDIMNDPLLRDAEFARLAAMGIKGVKIDFFQSDKQFIIGLYHDIARDAARHKLMVDFHGATIPRGWDRTYPNIVTMEGVRGSEQYWDKDFAECAQTYNSIYVFTRNAIGPMDYTPTIFEHPGAFNTNLQPHLTSYAHELALAVVFHSGIQHIVDHATSIVKQPDFVQNYLTELPSSWDESHVIAGAPGELAILARRSGSTWYLAGINGLKTAQTIKVPLSFLGAGKFDLSLITDGATPKEFAHAAKVAGANDELEIALLPRGGFAARLKQKK